MIGTDYYRCKCGRAYRHFELGRTRTFSPQIIENNEIRQTIVKLGLVPDIKRSDIFQGFLRIFTKRPFTADERSSIRKVLPSYSVHFVVED